MKYDTNKKPGLEPGIHTVTVKAYPQDVTTKNGFAMVEMEFGIEGSEYPIKQRYFPNQLTGIFVALGFDEVAPGVYDGDIQEAYGKSFKGEMYLEDYTKKDGTPGKGRRLRNFTAIEQSNNPDAVTSPADIGWEE